MKPDNREIVLSQYPRETPADIIRFKWVSICSLKHIVVVYIGIAKELSVLRLFFLEFPQHSYIVICQRINTSACLVLGTVFCNYTRIVHNRMLYSESLIFKTNSIPLNSKNFTSAESKIFPTVGFFAERLVRFIKILYRLTE